MVVGHATAHITSFRRVRWSSPSWWSYQCGYPSLNCYEYLVLGTWLSLLGSIPGHGWYIQGRNVSRCMPNHHQGAVIYRLSTTYPWICIQHIEPQHKRQHQQGWGSTSSHQVCHWRLPAHMQCVVPGIVVNGLWFEERCSWGGAPLVCQQGCTLCSTSSLSGHMLVCFVVTATAVCVDCSRVQATVQHTYWVHSVIWIYYRHFCSLLKEFIWINL
jgi:hypothetical protein